MVGRLKETGEGESIVFFCSATVGVGVGVIEIQISASKTIACGSTRVSSMRGASRAMICVTVYDD